MLRKIEIKKKIQENLESEYEIVSKFLKNFKKFLPEFVKKYNNLFALRYRMDTKEETIYKKEDEILKLLANFLSKCYQHSSVSTSRYIKSLIVSVGQNYISIMIPYEYFQDLNAREFLAVIIGDILFKLVTLEQVLGKSGQILTSIFIGASGFAGVMYFLKAMVSDNKEKAKSALTKSFISLFLLMVISVIYVSYLERKRLKVSIRILKKFGLQHEYVSAYKKVGKVKPLPKNFAARILKKLFLSVRLNSQSKLCTSLKVIIPDVKGTDLEVIYKELYKKYC